MAQAAERGELDPRRLDNYLKLRAEQVRTEETLVEKRRREKNFGKLYKRAKTSEMQGTRVTSNRAARSARSCPDQAWSSKTVFSPQPTPSHLYKTTLVAYSLSLIPEEVSYVDKIIDGKAIAAEIREEIAADVAALKEQGVTPGLAVVLVGDDPASRVYVTMKEKACEKAGIFSDEHKLPAETTEAQLLALIET